MSGVVLVGPFWTRDEAAGYLGITAKELCERDDVLRLDGHWLEETYPALQFQHGSVRHEVGVIVTEVADDIPGAVVTDWICRTNGLLGGMSPLDWLDAGLSLETVVSALHADMDDMRNRGNNRIVDTRVAS